MSKLVWAAVLVAGALFGLACDDGADDDADGVTDDDDDDNDDDNDDDDDNNNDNNNDDDDNDDDTSPAYFPLKDEAGRTLILHGGNFMAIEANGQPLDYERMIDWGFNVVRILITWDALEPEPGVYDEDYLPDIVEPQVAYAHDAGLRVILDMHQYHWSPCSGGMGMPEWICGDLGELPFQWLLQSGVFWNHPEYVDAFVAAWDKVAAHFAGDDRVFAYDLFNEPMAGLRTLPWTCENNLFRPLYLRLIETIRAHHVEPYLLVEPSIVTVAGFPSVMDPIDAERVVYAPHLYPGMLAEGGAYTFPYELLHRHMEKRTAESLRLGLPLLIGETGLRSSGENAEQYTRDATDLMEEKMAHWTWWAFGYDDDSMGLCYANGEPKEIFFPYLARPYPQATAGELRSFAFAFDTGVFNVSFANEAKLPPAVEIFVNAPYHYPDGFAVESTDPPGAWSYAFDEATSVVAVSCDPTALEHTITIRPADAR